MKSADRELKQWLKSLLPKDMSQATLAEELQVDRKTLGAMLSERNPSFGQGSTLIRYLQRVGGLNQAPKLNPADSLLARVEAKVDESVALTNEALRLLREVRRQEPEAPPADQAA